MNPQLDSFKYDDSIVRKFLWATFLWGLVGMLVGLLIALQLANPYFNFNVPWLSFGRLRPLHTNAVIFAFAGNAFFMGCYYSTQRLLKVRMFSDTLSNLHFWGWQSIIVSAALTLPLGSTQAKEYAELEWPIDILIAIVWVIFAVNFFGTMIRRRERHLYVAIWFYVASIVTVAVLHIFNNLSLPVGPLKSYSIYAGVQDAFMQWWYGPEEKLAVIERLRELGPVVMVGDGVNDAAAIAGATVGVGVRGGAEACLSAADVYLSRPGLDPLVDLVEGPQCTLGVIRRNIKFSVAYNLVGAALAVTGAINPLVAAVLMPLSSLTVVAASWRSACFKSPRP